MRFFSVFSHIYFIMLKLGRNENAMKIRNVNMGEMVTHVSPAVEVF